MFNKTGCMVLIIGLLALLGGCGGSSGSSTEAKTEFLFDGYEDYAHYVGGGNGLLGSVASGGPVTSYDGYLGSGYNIVTKGYFNQKDVNINTPVLDIDSLVKDGLIYSRDISENSAQMIAGNSAASYESSLSVNAGFDHSSFLFKQSFSSSFTASQQIASTTSFVKTAIGPRKKREYIKLSTITIDDLKGYRTATFKQDINDTNFPAGDIFGTYGTHVLLDISLGGRMELNYMYNNKAKKSEATLQAYASEISKTFSAQGEIKLSEGAQEFYENSSFQATQLGGTVTADITSLANAQAAYGVWSASLEGSNPMIEFVGAGDISNKYAITPIWLLADDPVRKKELEGAYLALLAENGKYFNDIQPGDPLLYVKDIYFGIDKNSGVAKANLQTSMQNADPYLTNVILDYDLNADCGRNTDYVYMGYTLTPKKNEAITGLKVHNSGANDQPSTWKNANATYTRIGSDLNSNAGGDWIYAYYTKDTHAGEPLTKIGIEFDIGNYTFGGLTTGWTSVNNFNGEKLDLNKNAGGKYIYMWQHR